MIKGIGCDIVNIERFRNHEDMASKILSEQEYNVFLKKKTNKHRLEFLAGRFAGKEAFFKAIGIKEGIITFKEIEILNDNMGQPILNYPNSHISISHERDTAIAFVVIES